MTKTAAKSKFRSPIAEAVHEGISGMHRLGLVDRQTMREFDVRCLTPVDDLTAADIVAMRDKAGVSQAVFARALNITTDYVSKIERGEKRPRGATSFRLRPATRVTASRPPGALSLVRRKGLDAIL